VGVPPDLIHVVQNGIDTTVFRPGARDSSFRTSLEIPDAALVIGHVARFSPVKNHKLLVEAFAQVARAHADVYLLLVGDGPLRPDIVARVTALGIGDRVRFLGQRSDLPPVYRELDLFVLSSNAEGTSMSILEAMASGLPIVATAVGGTPDLLGHGEGGVLVSPNDAGALATGITRLILDPSLRDDLGRRARERAVARFNEETVLDRYEQLYASERS
jgi:glycosyltransferase involved in cell wall biosynthesis